MTFGDDDLRAMEGAALPNPVHHAMDGEPVGPFCGLCDAKMTLGEWHQCSSWPAEVEATAWDPSQPLREDATEDQYEARVNWLWSHGGDSRSACSYAAAREYADAFSECLGSDLRLQAIKTFSEMCRADDAESALAYARADAERFAWLNAAALSGQFREFCATKNPGDYADMRDLVDHAMAYYAATEVPRG